MEWSRLTKGKMREVNGATTRVEARGGFSICVFGRVRHAVVGDERTKQIHLILPSAHEHALIAYWRQGGHGCGCVSCSLLPVSDWECVSSDGSAVPFFSLFCSPLLSSPLFFSALLPLTSLHLPLLFSPSACQLLPLLFSFCCVVRSFRPILRAFLGFATSFLAS